MSLKDRMLKKKIKAAVSTLRHHMTVDLLIAVQTGINSDIRHMTYPPGTEVTMCWSVDDINAVGDFDCDEHIMYELVGIAIGRTARQILLEIEPRIIEDVTASCQVMSHFDELQMEVVNRMLTESKERKPNWNVDVDAKVLAFTKQAAMLGL